MCEALTENVPLRFHPGEFIQEELEYRGISWDLFGKLSGIDDDTILQLQDGIIAVDKRIAKALAKSLGTSEQFWLNLQRLYDERG